MNPRTSRMPHPSDEQGIALVLAMLILTVFAIALSSAIYFTSTNSRSSKFQKASQTSATLADAGINNALAVLFNTRNAPYLMNTSLLPQRTSTYEGGTVTWKGKLTQDGTWHLEGTGSVPNPTGPGSAAIRRTTKVNVPIITPETKALSLAVWNWIYSGKTGSPDGCDTKLDQGVNLTAPLFVEGSLCLWSTSSIDRGPLVVRGRLMLNNPQNSVGANNRPVSEMVYVGAGCQWQQNALVNPCVHEPSTPRTNVFTTQNVLYGTLPVAVSDVTLPPVAWDTDPVTGEPGWYTYASPGPWSPCETVSGTPPTFDMTTWNPDTEWWEPDGWNVPDGGDVPGVFDLTPAGSDYTCKTSRGELSWNHTTHTLTVRGTIFIDGSATIQNSAVYRSPDDPNKAHAVIYLSGTLYMKNASLCAIKSGNSCDWNAWVPDDKLLVFATHSQGGMCAAGVGTQVYSSNFQGALYSDHDILTQTTSRTQGPLVGATVINVGQQNNVSFPTIHISPMGMPGYKPDAFSVGEPNSFG
jgi:hypothetical protein